jgi:hypothetical protein
MRRSLPRWRGGASRPRAGSPRGAGHFGDRVAGRALTFSHLGQFVRPVLVNGAPGVLVAPQGKLFSVMAFIVAGGKVAAIDVFAGPARLERLQLGR